MIVSLFLRETKFEISSLGKSFRHRRNLDQGEDFPKEFMFNPKEIAGRDYSKEFEFQASRSSGPGGQNVNKVETRVSLKFSVVDSQLLNEAEKQRLFTKWVNRLTSDGVLAIHSEEHRSQLRNKEETITAFKKLIEIAFTDPKPRKKSKPSKSSIRKRLDSKKKHSDKKSNRKRPDY